MKFDVRSCWYYDIMRSVFAIVTSVTCILCLCQSQWTGVYLISFVEIQEIVFCCFSLYKQLMWELSISRYLSTVRRSRASLQIAGAKEQICACWVVKCSLDSTGPGKNRQIEKLLAGKCFYLQGKNKEIHKGNILHSLQAN